MKVGRYDDSTGFNYAYIKPDISTLAHTTIESATFKVFAVWHHSSTAKNPVKLEEVTGDWTTSGVIWNTRPTTFNVGSVDIGRNQWANFDVTSSVRAWVTGARTNKGFMLHTVNQQDHWKKFAATETGKNIPYLEVKYTYNKPEKSVIKTKSNGAGTSTGSMNLTWDMVPGATGYKVIIGNGYNYEQFAVGNVTSWTTKGKGIFPTKAEIDKGLYTFRKDGKGEEFSNDPRALYENGYKAGSTFGLRNQTEYIVRIIATYPDGDSSSSDITEAYMPPETLPEKPEKPTIKTYSSGPETDTGYMDINWKSVPGAIDYKVVISNGYNYEYFQTGNIPIGQQKVKKYFQLKKKLTMGSMYFIKTVKETNLRMIHEIYMKMDINQEVLLDCKTKKSNAPIVLVHQLYLKPYPAGTNKALGHYLTVGGIRKSGEKYQAQLYNTQAGKQYHKVWWEDIGTGKGQNSTLTKAMYEKNLSSPNPVFVY